MPIEQMATDFFRRHSSTNVEKCVHSRSISRKNNHKIRTVIMRTKRGVLRCELNK